MHITECYTYIILYIICFLNTFENMFSLFYTTNYLTDGNEQQSDFRDLVEEDFCSRR